MLWNSLIYLYLYLMLSTYIYIQKILTPFFVFLVLQIRIDFIAEQDPDPAF